MKYYEEGGQWHDAYRYSQMLLSIGLYKEFSVHRGLLIAEHRLASMVPLNLVFSAIESFYIEDYQAVNQLTTLCGQRNISWYGIISGLEVYSHFVLGNVERANQLVDQFISLGDISSITAYCAFKWKHKGFDHFLTECENKKGSYRLNVHGHAVMILFIAMLVQEAPSNLIISAIQRYHQCNFFGVHPIHFWKLSECYTEVKLYRRASKYLERAYQRAEGQVPSISRDYHGRWTLLQRTLTLLKCDVCGAKDGGQECKLLPCSGCHEVWYCGRRCQKKGWVKGHRSQCSKQFVGFKQAIKKAKVSLYRDIDEYGESTLSHFRLPSGRLI